MSGRIINGNQHENGWIGWMHFLIVCAIGGSTFLAIRIAVGPGSGFPPLWMAASRFTTAGTLLLAVLALTGQVVKMPMRQLFAVLSSGMLLWGGGNGLASIASQKASSGLVAIFFAIGPLWVAAMEAILDRRRPSLLVLSGMMLGAGGVALLVLPKTAALPDDLTTVFALLTAPLSYAAGVVVLRRLGGKSSVLSTAGWQLIGGASALWIAVASCGEPIPSPTATAWAAWVYLILVGSIIGFTSFTAALRRLPTLVFMSHAWINPIIATGLGAIMLGELLTGSGIIAATFILTGLVVIVASTPNNRTQDGDRRNRIGETAKALHKLTVQPTLTGNVPKTNPASQTRRTTLREAFLIAFSAWNV